MEIVRDTIEAVSVTLKRAREKLGTRSGRQYFEGSFYQVNVIQQLLSYFPKAFAVMISLYHTIVTEEVITT